MGLQSTLPHKPTHATGGTDALTPADIGAQPAGSYATLEEGKIPAAQLPSYVDDVLEHADVAALPGTGETGKIYVTLDTGKCFRWSGSAFIEISPSPGSTDSVAEGTSNLYFTAARALAATQDALDGKASTAQGAKADGAVQKTGDTMTGLLTMDANVQLLPSRTIYAGDPEDPEATNTQIAHNGINLYNGAGISFGGVGDATARTNLRSQIGAEPTITTLPISKGGTGAATAAGALTALGAVGSDTTAAQGGTQLLNMVQITQAAYNAIVTPTANTLYIIVG